MSKKVKDSAANPSGTLYDYPTSELKNLAKEYNLAYYINNIERLQKSELVDAIMDHMAWKKAQEVVDNKVEFSKSLKGIKLNYDKTRDKKDPRQRLNYAELKAKHPILTAPHREIPKYKGKKVFGEKHLKTLPPQVQSALHGATPSVAEILGFFRSLTESQQKNVISNLGLTEAEVLPAGVPALGELDKEDEKEVAHTIHEVIEELQAKTEIPSPLQGMVVTKKPGSLEEYRASLGTPPKQWSGYFPKIDQWRYVTLAEELIKNPGLSQRELGKILESKGWNVGTSQSFISKQLAEVDKLKLIPKTPPKPKVVKDEPMNEIVTKPEPEPPKPKVETPKKTTKHTECHSYPEHKNDPEIIEFLNYLESIKSFVYGRYKEDAEGDEEMMRNLKTLVMCPFFLQGELFMGIQGTAELDAYQPGSNKWAVYYYNAKKHDITYIIGAAIPNKKDAWSTPDLFTVNIDEEWEDNFEHNSKEERDLVKLLDEIKIGKNRISFNGTATEKSIHFPWVFKKDGFPLATEKPKPGNRPEIPKVGGLIVDPKDMVGTYRGLWTDDQSKVVAQTLFNNPAQTKKILDIAHDLSTAFENTYPAEALGWRIIYQELYEFQKRMNKEYLIPATNDPAILKYYDELSSPLKPEAYKAMLKAQKNHGAHIEMLMLKAVRGLNDLQRKTIDREKESYLVPNIFNQADKLKALLGVDKDKDYAGWEATLKKAQHFPMKYNVKNLAVP